MSLPNLLIFFQADKDNGYGHKYRSLEVARVAREMGFNVNCMSNDKTATNWKFAINVHKNAMHLRQYAWKMWLNKLKPDWIIFDLENYPKDYMLEYSKNNNIKMANLNGPGWASANEDNVDQSWADLVWVQDSPEKVILRKDILNIRYNPIPNNWFVFGGSADPLGLLEKFEDAIERDPALLIGTNLRDPMTPKHRDHRYIECDGQTIWQHMALADRACIHMGISAFELATIGVKQYIFSRSAGHLHYAKLIESYGLGLAYPEIGLPDGKNIREFLQQKMVLNPKNKPDGLGVERFLNKLIEINNELE